MTTDRPTTTTHPDTPRSGSTPRRRSNKHSLIRPNTVHMRLPSSSCATPLTVPRCNRDHSRSANNAGLFHRSAPGRPPTASDAPRPFLRHETARLGSTIHMRPRPGRSTSVQPVEAIRSSTRSRPPVPDTVPSFRRRPTDRLRWPTAISAASPQSRHPAPGSSLCAPPSTRAFSSPATRRSTCGQRFQQAYRVSTTAGLKPLQHLANSAATLNRPDLHHDLVRVVRAASHTMSNPANLVNRVRSRLASSSTTVAPSERASAGRNLPQVGPAASPQSDHAAPVRHSRPITVHTRAQLRVTS